ncbi:MAG TPA: OmpH family outer membrane protein [Thermoanaerobaculia bacterium]|nr:OmpH family outer membrane protein [Thermoanaerobaculia bacterium]
MSFARFTRLAAIAALVVGLAAAAPADAQGGDRSMKIALIDVQRLVTDSAVGKEALGRLKSLQDAKVAEGKAMQDEIEALRRKRNEGALSLAADKLAEMEKQLEDKLIAFRRFQDDAEREIGKARETALAEVERKVMPIIEQAGQEFGYSLIFNKFQSGLVYADDAADITPLIIQRFDAAQGN